MRNRNGEGGSVGAGPTLTARPDIEWALGFPLSDEQWDAVSAPLAPTVIIAGAGTGKTTVMAARVLWLVATGQVAAGEVLGLTFTNKAAAELRDRVLGLLQRWQHRLNLVAQSCGQPTVATYHSFAGQLLADQGLRVGVEPGVRQLSELSVLQLAHRIACSLSAQIASKLSDQAPLAAPARLAAQIVRLDAELAEQVITTAQLRQFDAELADRVQAMPRISAGARAALAVAEVRSLLADLVDQLRCEKARRGLDFADQMRLAAQLASGGPESAVALRLRKTYPVVLLDEYQDTSIAQRMILSGLFAGHAVTAVGDPLQAIYGWRSASVANIDLFTTHFAAPGTARTSGGAGQRTCAGNDSMASVRDGAGVAAVGPVGQVRVLSVNRRSGSAILQAANDVAGQLRVMHPEVAALRPPKPRGAQVRAALLETHLAERQWVVNQVAGLVAEGVPAADIAVLARVAADLAPLAAALSVHGVPVSIAGRTPLLGNPFVAEVVRTLQVLADPGANAAIVGLLSGPRWRLGPADLALLAVRARELAAPAAPNDPSEDSIGLSATDPRQQPRQIVASSADSAAEQPWLLSAVLHPSDSHAELSVSGRERIKQFRSELARLRPEIDRGLVGLCQSIIEMTGAAVESQLAACAGEGSGAELDQFLDLVAGFADADGRTSLGAFVAWLELARSAGRSPELESDLLPGCVQMMTVHRAKGLEWPVVVLPALCDRRFPSAKPSPRWPTRADTVPTELRDDRAVLPRVSDMRPASLTRFREACKDYDRTGEDRLAYVAITRARDLLIASGHWWGPGPRMRGPSPYLLALRRHDTSLGGSVIGLQVPVVGGPRTPWAEPPQAGLDGSPAQNPLLALAQEYPWPAAGRPRTAAAGDAAGVAPGHHSPILPIGPTGPADTHEHLQSLDADIEVLLDQLRASEVSSVPPIPTLLSATEVMSVLRDPMKARQTLYRPLPRRANPGAELGTRFHAWVAGRLGQQLLIPDDELLGAADGVESDRALARLQVAFEELEYAGMAPVALEQPFVMQVGHALVRGRIDAVFSRSEATGVRWEVVDWKTSGAQRCDPIQLALYRLAWARIRKVPVSQVIASFVDVASGLVVRPDLPDGEELAEQLERAWCAGSAERSSAQGSVLRDTGNL